MKATCFVAILLAVGLSACFGTDAPPSNTDSTHSSTRAGHATVMASNAARLDAVSLATQNRAEELLNFAETSTLGTEFLWPHQSTQSWGPFLYRRYPRKDVYVGVVVQDGAPYTRGDVYLMGGPFGTQPVRVGRVDDFLGTPLEPPTSPFLAVDPPTWIANASEGESAHLYVTVRPQFAFEGKLYLRFDDPDGRWASQAASVDPGKSALTFWGSKPNLARGVHQGSVWVRLCATSDCSIEYPGSPVPIPYKLGVVRAMPRISFPWNDNDEITQAFLPSTANASVEVAVKAEIWPSEPVYFRAVDASGRVAGLGSLLPGGKERSIRFSVSLPAEPGTYAGRFMVQACWDPSCTEIVVSSSPRRYQFTREANEVVDSSIGATSHQGALSALPGVPDWTSAHGNSGHTGYVPARFDTSKFTLRWEWKLPAGTRYQRSQQATMAGKVALAVADESGMTPSELFVLSEADGSIVWRESSGAKSERYGAPALSKSMLYSVTRSSPPQLRAFDLSTGSRLFSATVDRDLLPIALVGNSVLMPYGSAEGVASIDSSTGRAIWRNHANASSGHGGFAPGSDGSSVFAYGVNKGTLAAYDLATGQAQFSIVDDALRGFSGPGVGSDALAVHKGRAFVVEEGALVAFDLAARRPLWRQMTGDYIRSVAVQGDLVIALRHTPSRVEARNARDGSLIWTSKPQFDLAKGLDAGFDSDPLLTENLVFVSTGRGVCALDRATGNPLWYYGKAGRIAISSNGVLTIFGGALYGFGGGVTAINLH